MQTIETFNLIVIGAIACVLLQYFRFVACDKNASSELKISYLAGLIALVAYTGLPLSLSIGNDVVFKIFATLETTIVFIFWFVSFRYFTDYPFSKKLLIAAGLFVLVQTLVFAVSLTFGTSEWFSNITRLLQIAHLTLLGSILFVIARGFRADLIDSRRKIRLFLIVFVSFALCLALGFEFYHYELRRLDSVFLLVANLALALILLTVLEFLKSHPLLLIPPQFKLRPISDSKIECSKNSFVGKKLDQAMLVEKVFLNDNLDLAGLAEHVKLPEYKIRQHISKIDGFANINQYLAHYRVAHAKEALEDPQRAKEKIVTIAYESGFGSLSAFNRAFKQSTEMTPSAYRKSLVSLD